MTTTGEASTTGILSTTGASSTTAASTTTAGSTSTSTTGIVCPNLSGIEDFKCYTEVHVQTHAEIFASQPV